MNVIEFQHCVQFLVLGWLAGTRLGVACIILTLAALQNAVVLTLSAFGRNDAYDVLAFLLASTSAKAGQSLVLLI